MTISHKNKPLILGRDSKGTPAGTHLVSGTGCQEWSITLQNNFL